MNERRVLYVKELIEENKKKIEELEEKFKSFNYNSMSFDIALQCERIKGENQMLKQFLYWVECDKEDSL